jgi:small Trp-rich protein
MYFLGLGVVLLLMKYMEIAPVATWSWLVVLAPFALAVAWWSIADATGYTKKKEMDKMEKRKTDRIAKNRDAMGINARKK